MKRSVASLLPALCLLLPGSLARADSPASVLNRFVDLRIRQIKETCRADNTELPPAYTAVIDAVKAGDRLAASNGFARVRMAQGSYEGVTPEPQLRIDSWKDLRDVYCAFKEFSNWSPDLLDLYSRDILGVIPSNSIYFGGSDSGRFIITAYQETAGKPFFVLAQNELADSLYMMRLQASIGSAVRLPDRAEVNAAFQQYIADVQAGRLDPADSGSMDSRPFQEHVPPGVMGINGILARMIFDKNKETHPFYVEESQVIPWMYLYLQPAGLIMKLNPEPVTITPEIVNEDRRFWAVYTNTLLSHPAFPRDTRARAAFAKMRAAIGGLYVHARLFPEAEYAFKEALSLYPISPEASFRLADLYARMDRFPDAIEVMASYTNRSPDNQQATAYLEDLKLRARVTVRARELESLLGSGKGSVKETLELAEQYRLLKQDADMLKRLNSITASTNMPPASYKQAATILAAARKFTEAAAAQQKYLDQTSGAYADWIDLAAYYLAAGKAEGCVQAMINAIKAGGDKARESLRTDIRLQAVQKTPLFQTLTTFSATPPLSAAPPALTNATLDLGHGVALDLVAIQPGTFTMGSATDGHDGPAHAVTLTRHYYLGKFEVTQAHWQEVTGANPSQFTNGPDAGRRPVERASWTDIRDGFLPKLAGRLPQGWTPRLPTEAEWEYACRAGSTNGYCFGDNTNELAAYAWFDANAGQTTHPVGLKKPNAWGLYDMHGNVWEWCADWKAPYSPAAVTNPAGPAAGDGKANRGGSWYFNTIYSRSARRSINEPATTRGGNLGFRLAVSVEPK